MFELANFCCTFLLSFCLLFCPYNISAWEISSSATRTGSFCAKIFAEANFAGAHFQLQENVQISNFHTFRNRIPEWNSNRSISFQVEPECSLVLATQAYMKGDVTEFEGEQEAISQDLTKSLICSCDKNCNCNDIALKSDECARAYLETDCSHCNSYYTTMTEGTRQVFPSKFSGKVKSIVLRQGCSLTLIDGTTISQPVTQNWTGNPLSSYSCNCNFTTAAPRQPKKKAAYNDIPMIDVPKQRSQINSMLKADANKNHPGLIGGLQSLRIKRSSHNAYILLLGLTGSGKSTTVNFLFSNPNITKVGGISSTTTDILEFRIPVPVAQLGIRNSELRIIDTPGIADTRGIAQDAQFLATLEAYFAKHDELKDKLPNVVLIFFNLNNNRYMGEGSSFVKMLKTLELFRDRIIDRKYSNIVFVLTHFMSENKVILRDPSEKLHNIRRVIQEHSTLPDPIILVLAENKPVEHGLPTLNGYYRLPNGEFYPQNLFSQIERVLVGAGDPIGNAIIQTAFQNSEDMQIGCRPFPLMAADHPKVVKYLATLGTLERPIDHTEISKILNTTYQSIDAELKRNYPETLNHLKRVCHARGIFDKSDLPQTSVQILKFVKEIHQNPLSAALVQNGLNISVPIFKGDVFVGSGYDIINDRPLPTTIFDSSRYLPSETGFQFPSNLELNTMNQISTVFQIVQSNEEYLPQRASDLGLQELEVDPILFSGELKAGYNIANQDKMSALLEYHLFQANLKKDFELHPEFLAVLLNLSIFNQSDFEAVQNWTNFFEKYGTHIVIQARGGGSIEITVENPVDDEGSTAEGFSKLSGAMGSIVQHMANFFIGDETEFNASSDVSYKIQMNGGEDKFLFTNLSHTFENPLDKWKDSVEFNPVMLQTYLSLMPITEVLKLASRQNGDLKEAAERMEVASRALFNSSLLYVPVTPIRFVPNSRDRSGSGLDNAIGDFETMQEFAKIFKMMTDESKRMQENFLNLMIKADEDAKLQNEQWEREAKERKNEAREKKEEETRLAAIEREERRLDKQLELEREKIQAKRVSDEAALRLQIEHNRQQIEAARESAREQLRAQELSTLMNFMAAENRILAQQRMNKKSTLDTIFGFTQGVVKSVTGAFIRPQQSMNGHQSGSPSLQPSHPTQAVLPFDPPTQFRPTGPPTQFRPSEPPAQVRPSDHRSTSGPSGLGPISGPPGLGPW